MNKLTKYDSDNHIQPDADKWRQCHRCGSVYPTYQVKQEGKLADFAETLDNPFDFGKGVIMSIGEIRKFDRTGKRQHKKKVKRDLSNIKDPELRSEIAKGAELISYEEQIPKGSKDYSPSILQV